MASRIINLIRGKHLLEYDAGKFDDWCIYLTRYQRVRYPPLDTEYFSVLASLGHKHGHKRIYDDFVKIYTTTTKFLDLNAIALIGRIAESYNEDAEELEIWFTVIYAGMIAEENKAFTKLGKRIKRLGIHQTLMERLSPNVAANFSKGKDWRELDLIMLSKGF